MKTKFQIYIIDKLRRIREDKNTSQASVARVLCISPGQLGNIESYKRSHKYTLRQIYTLSSFFNVSVEEIFSTTELQILRGNVNKVLEQIIKYQDDKEEN